MAYGTNVPVYGGLATTSGYKVFNRSGTSPLAVQNSGIGATEAVWDEHMGSFVVDIFDDVRKSMPEEFPLLALLGDIGSEKTGTQMYSYAEGKEGSDSIWVKYNNLRLRQSETSPTFNDAYTQVDPGNASYYGGKLPIRGCLVNLPALTTALAANNISYLVNRGAGPGFVQAAAVATDLVAGTAIANAVDYNAAAVGDDNDLTTNHAFFSDHMISCRNLAGTARGQYLSILLNVSNDVTVGTKEDIIMKYVNTLQVNKYTLVNNVTAPTLNKVTLGECRTLYAGTNALVVLGAFANIAYRVNSDPDGANAYVWKQKNNITPKVYSMTYAKNMATVIITFDMAASNIDGYTSVGDQELTVLLDEVAHPSTITAFPNGGYTRFCEHILINRYNNRPKLVPEGSNFRRGGGYIFQSDARWNNVQIFESEKYGITGSRMADQKFRFYDDMKMTRERHLRAYNRNRQNTYLWGQKTNGYYTAAAPTDYEDNMPIRGTGGMFDLSLHNISFSKCPIPATAGGGMLGTVFQTWIESLILATKKKAKTANPNRTMLVGKELLRLLGWWEQYLRSTTSSSGSILGANNFTYVKDAIMTLGIGTYRYETIEGAISFVYDESMDYLTDFTLPYWWTYGLHVNPRFLAISLDKTNIKEKIFRPDKMFTNIQDLGRDAYEEGMRGESGIELTDCSGHAIFDMTPI